MIRQTTDKISAEITNARGGYSGLDMRLDNTDAQLQFATFWNNPDSDKSNLAAVKLDSDDDSSSLALVVMNKDGDQVVNGANIVLGANGEDSYIQFDADVINFTAEDYQVIANNIDLTGKKISISADGVDIDASDGEFSIQSTNFSVDTNGNITANGGKIGSWNITANAITQKLEGDDYSRAIISGSGVQAALYKVGDSDYRQDWTIWIGDNVATSDGVHRPNGKFGVTNAGILYASGAHISGTLSAGGWTISGGTIISDKYNNSSNNLIALMAPTKIASSGVGSDVFVVRINGTDNFRLNSDGTLLCTKAKITGTLEAGSIISYGTILGAKDGNNLTLKVAEYIGSDKIKYKGLIMNSTSGHASVYAGEYTDTMQQGCVRLKTFAYAGGQSFNTELVMIGPYGELNGTWSSNSFVANNSDKNIKNSIINLSDSYSSFFDNLTPRLFKYNDGTSNRYHTGFIAQEVKSALDIAKIDSKDFAGLVIFNQNTEAERWTLRYEEFIALNTSEIQKSKSRITELETRVAELEALIKGE